MEEARDLVRHVLWLVNTVLKPSCPKLWAAQVMLGFKVGGGMAFGGAYKTHGLYAYNSGKYKGEAYFGRGGKGIGACALAGQFRPQY